VRGLETDVGLKLRQLLDDLPYVLVGITLGVNDDWVSFLDKEKANIVLDVSRPCNLNEARHELQVQKALVDALAYQPIPLIQLSSFRVYGEAYIENNSEESEFPSPDDEFGKTLVALEQCTATLEKHINLRLSWFLDGRCSLFERLVPSILSGEPLVVSDHKFGRPISIGCVATILFALIQQILSGANNWGNYHLHSSDFCSEAEFCDHLCRFLSLELDRDISMPEVATKGDSRSFFVGSGNIQGRRITDDFGIQFSSWRSGFRKLLDLWLQTNGIVEKETIE